MRWRLRTLLAGVQCLITHEPAMFRFFIRDVLWLTALVAISACWWSDRNSLARLSRRSQSDKQRLQQQREALESHTLENSTLKVQLRNRQSIDEQRRSLEAEPGVYFLDPRPGRLPGGRGGLRSRQLLVVKRRPEHAAYLPALTFPKSEIQRPTLRLFELRRAARAISKTENRPLQVPAGQRVASRLASTVSRQARLLLWPRSLLARPFTISERTPGSS